MKAHVIRRISEHLSGNDQKIKKFDNHRGKLVTGPFKAFTEASLSNLNYQPSERGSIAHSRLSQSMQMSVMKKKSRPASSYISH